MKKIKQIISGLLIAVMALSVVSFGSIQVEAKSTKLKTISIAVSSDIIPSIKRVKSPLKKLGYKLDVHEFDDWVMPNTALAEGDVDCNFFEHEPYMDAYNKSKGANLVMIKPKIYSTPYGFFSHTINSLDEIKDGSKVALSDESSNRNRSFLLLQEAGLITLSKKPKDKYYDEGDVKKNPHNLQFVKTDSNSLYSLIDEVDLVVEPCDLVNNAGGDATDTLYREKSNKYAMGIAVRKGDYDKKAIKALNDAFHSKEFRDSLEKDYPGVYQFVEEDK